MVQLLITKLSSSSFFIIYITFFSDSPVLSSPVYKEVDPGGLGSTQVLGPQIFILQTPSCHTNPIISIQDPKGP